MIALLVRTLILYVFLLGSMRLMGKRQIGELDVSDLVTTLLFSEIAALPLTNLEIPLTHAIVPTVTLLFLEVFFSHLLARSRRLKNLLAPPPSILIDHGVFNQKEMENCRISPEELLTALRQSGILDPGEVCYAILEKNGKITIIPKSFARAPTCKEMKIKTEDEELRHIVAAGGKEDEKGLALIQRDRAWLLQTLGKEKTALKDVFCMTADASGRYTVIKKEGKRK